MVKINRKEAQFLIGSLLAVCNEFPMEDSEYKPYCKMIGKLMGGISIKDTEDKRIWDFMEKE